MSHTRKTKRRVSRPYAFRLPLLADVDYVSELDALIADGGQSDTLAGIVCAWLDARAGRVQMDASDYSDMEARIEQRLRDWVLDLLGDDTRMAQLNTVHHAVIGGDAVDPDVLANMLADLDR